MIGRWGQTDQEDVDDGPKGFDSYELRLGDIMRGERATLGKSLLDVQRELKIKANYIAAIENSDASVFDTPGFIAGFVRSYARYLGLDPEWAFQRFSEESGFTKVHGMSADALPARKAERVSGRPAAEALAEPMVPFNPSESPVWANVEPRAIGSTLVLVTLIAGLGYGAWMLLEEVQRVDLAPIERAPTVSTDVASFSGGSDIALPGSNAPAGPSTEALERLYRPQALDVPVMTARDAPIASLDPSSQGVFAAGPRIGALPQTDQTIQVVDGETPEIALVAVQPTWVRVQTPSRSVVFEKVLEPGQEYAVPVTEETPVLRAGNAGALYFRVNGTLVGPAGSEASIVSDVLLASTDLSAAFAPANPLEDRALFDLLQELGSPDVLPLSAVPDLSEARVALVSREDSWVRVRDENGTVRFEGIVPPGRVQPLPENFEAGTLRAGNSGALYFRVGALFFGPAGRPAQTISNVAMSAEAIRENYPLVDGPALGLASE
ncbi:MAG: RodZ domain-containing protein [Pseudomonadota bacterium]